jgi:hypothetical protein
MRSSLRYDEPAFLEHIERGGLRVEFREKGDDGAISAGGWYPDLRPKKI